MDNNNKQSKIFDFSYKVLVLGESRVGKTSILKRLDNQSFSENTVSTVGIDFVNVFYCIENAIIKLQIWDTAGQERFHTLTRSYFNKTKAVVLVYDITKMESFEKLEYWMECIEDMQLISEIVILIGNKIDMESQRQVSYEYASKFANRNSIKFFEISAKNTINLFETFKTLATDVFDSNDMYKMGLSLQTKEKFAYNYNMPQEIILRNTLTNPKKYRYNLFRRKKKESKISSNEVDIQHKHKKRKKKAKSQNSIIKLNNKKEKDQNCCKIS